MTAPSAPAYGATPILIALGALLLVAAVCVGVKVRAVTRRGFGVHVYDFGADLTLPRTLHSRSYRIALYLTMKSLPREGSPAPAEPKLNAPAEAR